MYGSRNAEIEQVARNGIEFIEAALKLVPDCPAYLNTYGLLVADGLGDTTLGLEILGKAAQLAPDDIQIRQNIRDLQKRDPVLSTNTVIAPFAVLAIILIIFLIIVLIYVAQR